MNHLEYHLCQQADRTGRLILKPVRANRATTDDNHATNTITFRVIHETPTKTQSVKNFDKCKQWRWGDTLNGFGVNVVRSMGKRRVSWHTKRKTLTLLRGSVDMDELYSTIESLALQACKCVMAAARLKIFKDEACELAGDNETLDTATLQNRKRCNDDAAAICFESSQPPSPRRSKDQSLTCNRNDDVDAAGEASDDNTRATRHHDDDMEEACDDEKETSDDDMEY